MAVMTWSIFAELKRTYRNEDNQQAGFSSQDSARRFKILVESVLSVMSTYVSPVWIRDDTTIHRREGGAGGVP